MANLDKLRDIVAQLSVDYNVEMPAVAIEYMWTTVDMGSYNHTGPGVISLNEECFSKSDERLLFIVAHEFKHHIQRLSGELRDFNTRSMSRGLFEPIDYVCMGIWKGEYVEITVHNNEEYQLIPWEQDANLFAAEYVLSKKQQRRTA